MMNFFKKKKKTIKDRSLSELFDDCPWMGAYTKSHILNEYNEGKTEFFLNPYKQNCFNYGYFTIEDFRDWSRGTGKIVKGENEKEKGAVMVYVKGEIKYGWELWMNFKYFDLINCGSKFDSSPKLMGLNMYAKNQIDKLNELYEQIAIHAQKMYLPDFLDELDIDSEHFNENRLKSMQEQIKCYVKGALNVLFMTKPNLYYGAINVEKIENLSFMGDVTCSYAYYLFLKKRGHNIDAYFDSVKGVIKI